LGGRKRWMVVRTGETMLLGVGKGSRSLALARRHVWGGGWWFALVKRRFWGGWWLGWMKRQGQGKKEAGGGSGE
jgi:hypothetical protein